jgi:hypothetical protein
MAISPSYGDGADKGAGPSTRMSTSAAWTRLKRGAGISVTRIAGEVDGVEPEVALKIGGAKPPALLVDPG